ncbi:MAG: hypothetical protein RL119_995 [Actinomycetota bacterium]
MAQQTSRRIFGFPATVNEISARVVATGVVAQAVVFLVWRQWWLLIPLAYGFVARVLAGPTLSPLGQLATRVITPRLGRPERIVPGPPKRFAQFIGALFSLGALLAWGLGSPTVSVVLMIGLLIAASLEAFVGFCLGCKIFGLLMKVGIVPESVCEACQDITRRSPEATSTAVASDQPLSTAAKDQLVGS